MNKLIFPLTTITLTSIITGCGHTPIKNNHTKNSKPLLVETLCESETGTFRYMRIYQKSELQPQFEYIDEGDNGTFEFMKNREYWSPVITNNTPESMRKGTITTYANCQETTDPHGKPMKKYWESSFFSNNQQ